LKQMLSGLVTSCRSREFVLASVFVPEDSESENEGVNDRLEGTFWCICERCEIMPTQRECVCCLEQPGARVRLFTQKQKKKTDKKNLRAYY